MLGEIYQIIRDVMLPVLTVIYIIPVVSLVFFPLDKKIKCSGFHAAVGRIEWVFSFLRDFFITLLILFYISYSLIRYLTGADGGFDYQLLFLLGFVAISVLAYLNRRRKIKNFVKFISGFYILHPSEFFKYYYASVSGLPGTLPETSSMKIELPFDATNGKKGISFWPAVPGVINTGIFARLVIRASKWGDKDFCRKVGDVISATWGARVVQLARAKLDAEGIHNLKTVSGRTIFVSNHKSFLDFAVIPFVIGVANLERETPFRARYMAAREHFYDNKFLYSVVGIGKALEKVGAVFVDRRSKKRKASEAVDEAVLSVLRDDLDIVMYPQGTRAPGNKLENGQRFDAGYYTTVTEKSLEKERGHLKKGIAYLAVDVAVGFGRGRRQLNIVPIGLLGTATVVPRGKIKVQKGVEIKAFVGRPVILNPESVARLTALRSDSPEFAEVRGEMVESLFVKTDEKLKDILRVNEELNKRLMIDLRKMMRDDIIEKFLVALDAWRDDEDLIFSVFDCIYTLPPKLWSSYMNRLAQLLVETDTSRETILDFKRVIVREISKNL